MPGVCPSRPGSVGLVRYARCPIPIGWRTCKRWPGRARKVGFGSSRARARGCGCVRWSSCLLSLLFLSQLVYVAPIAAAWRSTASCQAIEPLARDAVELLLSTSCRTGRRLLLVLESPDRAHLSHSSKSLSTRFNAIGWISLLAFSAALMLMLIVVEENREVHVYSITVVRGQ